MKKSTSSKSPIQGINPTVEPSGTGCVECLKLAAEGKEAWWLHLRRCAECGHIGCCNSSPNQHAQAHYHETKHPIIQSFEKEDEGWFYNYKTDQELDDVHVKLAGAQYHPESQSVPFYPHVAVVKKTRSRKKAA